jgi:hypothetical protein
VVEREVEMNGVHSDRGGRDLYPVERSDRRQASGAA